MSREFGAGAGKIISCLLRIGYLRSYSGGEFFNALELFTERYPEVSVHVERGNHEELHAMLCSGEADLVLNDQRRAFSDEYVNLILATVGSYIWCARKGKSCGITAPSGRKTIPATMWRSSRIF